jgi:hypothetical protein
MASPLTIDQLFTPSPPGINSQNPAGTIAPTSWLGTLLADGTSLGLPTTAWQPGQPIRTIMAIQAVELAKEDSFISQQAQGGFLDFAATGTVTFTDLDGTTTTVPVSPDPSIQGQNPSATLTWLDLLANSVYNVYRSPAEAAAGTLYFANISGSTSGTYAAGTFHTLNTLTQATYANASPFTGTASTNIGGGVTFASEIPQVVLTTASAHGLSTGTVIYVWNVGIVSNDFYAVTVVNATQFSLDGTGSSYAGPFTLGGAVYSTQAVGIAADLIGTVGNAAPGAITQLITSAPKCFVVNLTSLGGANWQSNVSLASQCRAKLATLSPNGAPGAYLFYALAAYLILNGESVGVSPPNVTTAVANYLLATGASLPSPLPTLVTLDGGPITRALVAASPTTGVVTTTLANASGPVAGCMNLAITNASPSGPIQITTSAPHNLVTGDYVQVNLVQGLSGANGTFVCTFVSSTQITLNGTSGSGSYTASTGQLSGGDLYAVNQVINAYCTPNATTSTTKSAVGLAPVIAGTVYVPNAFVTTYQTNLTNLFNSYFASFPIGGLNVDTKTNVLPIGAIEGLLWAAGANGSGGYFTLSTTGVTINGVAQDYSMGAQGVIDYPVPTSGIVVMGQ